MILLLRRQTTFLVVQILLLLELLMHSGTLVKERVRLIINSRDGHWFLSHSSDSKILVSMLSFHSVCLIPSAGGASQFAIYPRITGGHTADLCEVLLYLCKALTGITQQSESGKNSNRDKSKLGQLELISFNFLLNHWFIYGVGRRLVKISKDWKPDISIFASFLEQTCFDKALCKGFTLYIHISFLR